MREQRKNPVSELKGRNGGEWFNRLSMSIANLSGKVYPDKTFTVGRVAKKKKRAEDKRYDREWAAQAPTNYINVADWLIGNANIHGEFCSLSENPRDNTEVFQARTGTVKVIEVLKEVDNVTNGDYSKFYGVTEDVQQPLFIVGAKSSQNVRGAYGQHGITKYGKRVVRNAALLLEREYGKGRLGFITCTLPTFSEQVQRTINGSWGEITRRFYQAVKRKAESRGRKFIYVGVTEIQEKRFRRYGVPCPHLHFVYLCRDCPRSPYLLDIAELHRLWNKAIKQVVRKMLPNLCMDAEFRTGSVHGATIKKSASGYLGKYISKGCKVLEAMKEEGWDEFPKQWWTASKFAKEMFRKSIKKIPTHVCNQIFYGLGEMLQNGDVIGGSFVWVEVGGQDFCAGFAGIMSSRLYNSIRR